MRSAADVPLGYYVVHPPTLFEEKLPIEGSKFNSTIAREFLIHLYEG